jgi:high-affinity nickel-transport protein
MSALVKTAAPFPGLARRTRLAGVFGVIVLLHVLGWTLYVWHVGNLGAASGFASAGLLAYLLGMRHAFDADHIAAIDDTTRLMILRGQRPVGVGFFFALGHSSVVMILAVITAFAAAQLSVGGMEQVQTIGGHVSVGIAIGFLLLVAATNAAALRGLTTIWRRYRAGRVSDAAVGRLLNRGLLNRLLGARARLLIRSSWHMAPAGFLFGLGLGTASEVALLALSATTASQQHLPFAAVLSLPLLFAAGMTLLDTADSLLMSRAYTWASHQPGRRLYYNVATTALTVVVGLFVASVYIAGAIADQVHVAWIAAYGALADMFELFGYGIVAFFLLAWLSAVLLWRMKYSPPEAVST